MAITSGAETGGGLAAGARAGGSRLDKWQSDERPAERTSAQGPKPAPEVPGEDPVWRPMGGPQPGVSFGTTGGVDPKMYAAKKDMANPTDVKEQDAQKRLAEAKLKREDALKGYEKVDTFELSEKDYLALNDRQRDAIDFNTMLADASDKDKASQDEYAKLTPQARMTYDERVKNMFGKDGGSELYAPETMAVLDQLKIKDKVGDLDQYLNLQVAITEDDMANLETSSAGTKNATESSTPDERYTLTNRFTDKVGALEEALVKGNKMLDSFRSSAAVERQDYKVNLGGDPTAPKVGPGFGQSELDDYFRGALTTLSVAGDADRDEILGIIKQEQGPDGLNQFLQFADQRTRNAIEGGTTTGFADKLGDREEARDPAAMRDLLGLGK